MGRDCEIVDGGTLPQTEPAPRMLRSGNWLVFFQQGEGAPVLNAYVRACSTQEAIDRAGQWTPAVIVCGVLSPLVQDQLHIS